MNRGRGAISSRDTEIQVTPEIQQELPLQSGVFQHAAALRHLVQQFVKEGKPLPELLIKAAHKIMMESLSGEDAGVVGNKSFAGTYHADHQQAYIGGGHQFPKPSEVPNQVQAMVNR
ncbi:hypothetical protein AC579_5647 [Pseudocercospora musae]|uniref:Uncharacterized protein n=1 Tax=Pseudocercospora musae TaxID=113226 RepID=A0A139IEN2_9PEZI|nr:hypothetical protein AC579_5647 [Pseudocercospora musae]